jgi:uroporphyrinogen decarboxylase
VLAACNHQEPDRVPFDLGGMAQSGIHRLAYENLREWLSLPDAPTRLLNVITQVARQDDDFQQRLCIDTCLVYGRWADPADVQFGEEGQYLTYTDEWGVGRRMSREGGYYFDMCSHPLGADDIEAAWADFPWPDPTIPARFAGLREEAKRARDTGRFVVLMGLCPGIVEMYSWLRGLDRFYVDLACEPKVAERFLEKMVQLKSAYWLRALSEVGECIDAVNEADDLAGQTSLLISPEMYRRIIKPHHRNLLAQIRKCAPHVKILFHSCGAVRPILPDLIEIGVDILNPVQTSASGMDPHELKREYGQDLCFWGGGIDAQHVLGTGPLHRIRDDVRRNIRSLAPGGGFVFAPTHIIQPNVPPQNIMAMWETLQQEREYSR